MLLVGWLASQVRDRGRQAAAETQQTGGGRCREVKIRDRKVAGRVE